MLCCLVSVILCVVCSSNVCARKEYPALDSLKQGLMKEVWDNGEKLCLGKTLELLDNVKNFTLWATWVWNANKFPSGNFYGSWIQLGNFDQCMKPPWLDTHPQFKTQYCLAQVKMVENNLTKRIFDPYESAEVFLRTKTRSGLYVNQFTWGVCLPAVCQTRSIAKIVRQMYLGTHFRAMSHPNITVDECQVAGTKKEYPMGFYVFIGLLAMLFITAVCSTYYRLYKACDDTSADSIVATILKSFCMVKNSAELVKVNKDEIKVLNGIRFITAAFIVLLHVMFFTILSGCVNTRDLDNNMESFSKILNMNVLVDTFFALSGLLHIRGLLAKEQNLLLMLCKRYVRLFGLFALSIFYVTSVFKYVDSGPLWHKIYDPECTSCQKNWLLSLLMINSSTQTICYMVTWYQACDYQLTVFATILFYIYKKKRRLAISIFGVSAVMSLLIPGFLTYWHKLPIIFFTDLEYALNMRGYDPLDYTYIKSYSRAGPYLAGIAMGYFMHAYKPAHYKKSVSLFYSISGMILSLILMLLSLGLASFFLDRKYDPIEAGVAAGLYRAVWAVAVCCIIGLCEYGTVPLVTGFLSRSFFTPLSRLSYGLFMVHSLIIHRSSRITPMRLPPVCDGFTLIIDAIGIGTVSLGISYILWLIVEAPLINLSNNFIFNRFNANQNIGTKKNEVQHRREKNKIL